MTVTRLLDYCESEHVWIVDTTTALACLESPTHDKAAVDRCGADLARRLADLGGAVEILRRETSGDHLRATFGDGARQLLLLGHFDTVWPVGQIERMPVGEKDGCLYGPGVFDMKAGIAIAMMAVQALDVTGRRPADTRLVMLWTADEERGSVSSREAVELEARRSDAVLVLEPSLPGGALKTTRRGCGEFRLTVRGVAAHAGIEPEKGASAIQELAAQIIALGTYQDLDRGVSINVGVIEGGTAGNVVAAEARATVDVRVSTADDARRLQEAIGALRPTRAGTTLEFAGGFSRPPLERSKAVARLYGLAREVAAEMGRDLEEGGSGGGSDGNLTAALGVPTLDGLGAVGDGAHALHEHIELAHLPWRAALLAGVIARLGET